MTRQQGGFIYLWALFAVTIAGIVMAATGEVWRIQSQREKEAELLFIGEQFRKAVMSYYNGAGNTKEYPKTLEDLLQDTRQVTVKRHLRKIYADPFAGSENSGWGLIEEETPDTGSLASSNIAKRITGVHSLSEMKPIKKEKFPEHYVKFSEALTYRDWKFIYKPGETASTTKAAPQQQKTNAPGASPSPFGGPQSPQSPGASPFPSQPPATGNPSPFSQQPATTPRASTGSQSFQDFD